MDGKLELELFTRPMCSDCQDAKTYLSSNDIRYIDKDVSKNFDMEEDLKKISGTRIVPVFAFYKKGLLGKRKLVKHFIGFENNKAELVRMLNKK